MFKKVSSSLKLFLLISIILLTGLIVISSISIYLLKTSLSQEVYNKQQLIGRSSTRVISDFIQNIEGVMNSTSELDIIKDTSEFSELELQYRGLPESKGVKQRNHFKNLMKEYPDIIGIEILTKEEAKNVLIEPFEYQLLLTENDFLDGFYYRDYYKKIIDSESSSISDIYISAALRRPMINITTPIFDDSNNMTAFILTAVLFDDLQNFMKKLTYGSTGITYIVTSKGQIAGHPGYESAKEAIDINNSDIILTISENKDGSKPFITTDPISGRKVVATIQKVDSFDWFVVTQQDYDEAYALIIKLSYILIIGYIVVLSMISLFIYLKVNKWLVVPVRNLIVITKKMASGEYNIENDIESEFLEIKELADNFEIMSDQIKRRDDELKQFIYIASHDLQEPLRMVTSYMQIVEKRYKDKLDENGVRFISYAVNGANRMKKLILDLLEYSSVDREYDTNESIDLNLILNKMKMNLYVMIESTGAVLVYDELPIIKGNLNQIEQLIENIISNGIKYQNNRTPKIEINCEKSDKFWCLSISDNGIGIKEEYLEMIFEVFKRLHSKDEYQGTGIGLAICKKIVEKHKGFIYVESIENEGTTFFIKLPMGGKENE